MMTDWLAFENTNFLLNTVSVELFAVGGWFEFELLPYVHLQKVNF